MGVHPRLPGQVGLATPTPDIMPISQEQSVQTPSPILHPQPPQVNGITYPYLDVSLSMSTRDNGPGIALSLVVTLTPYRQLADGIEKLKEFQKVYVWGDALLSAQSDPSVAAFIGALQVAGQAFVNEAF